MGGKSSSPTISNYLVDLQFILGHSVFDSISKIIVDDKIAWGGLVTTNSEININAPQLFGGSSREGGIVGPVDVNFGAPNQPVNSYLANLLGQIPAFRGVVSIITKKVNIGPNYYLKPWAFEATRIHKTSIGDQQWQDSIAEVPATRDYLPDVASITYRFDLDTSTYIADINFSKDVTINLGESITIAGASPTTYNGTFTVTGVNGATVSYTLPSNPNSNASGYTIVDLNITGLMNGIHILREIYTDTVWGLGNPSSLIDETSFYNAAVQCYNEGLGFAFFWDMEGTIDDFKTEVEKHIRGNVYLDRSTGTYKVNLLRKITDTSSLLILNESNVVSVKDFKRKQLGELTTSITVEFTNIETGKKDSVTRVDIALAQRQGKIISKTIKYDGIVTAAIAEKYAILELQELTVPAYSFTVVCTTVAENLNIGDAFILDHPDTISGQIVARVLDIDLGSIDNKTISIKAIQDFFSVPTITHALPPISGWSNPVHNPTPLVYSDLIEAPYYFIVKDRGDIFAQNVATTDSYIACYGVSPTNDSMSAAIYTTTGTNYTRHGTMDFCFTALLSTGIDRQETSLLMSSVIDIELLYTGSIILLEEEFMEVTNINTGTNTLTVTRGVLDTVPVSHASSTRMFGIEDFFGSDEVVYPIGSLVKMKLATITPKGELSINNAPEDTFTLIGRLHLPYRPANVKINNSYWPATITTAVATAGLPITWAHRNRFTETTDTSISFYSTSITSEPGVTYSGELIRTDTLAVLASFTGLTGSSTTLSSVTYVGEVNFTMRSSRDGLDSFQEITHTFDIV